jgi:hypothetical protein
MRPGFSAKSAAGDSPVLVQRAELEVVDEDVDTVAEEAAQPLHLRGVLEVDNRASRG